MEIKNFIARIRHINRPKQGHYPIEADLPLRAELFNAEQMERYGKTLAMSHTAAKKPTPDLLLKRLADNEETLRKACKILASFTSENNRIAPAAKWLLDNFYLMEEQIRITKHHLPKNYGKSLVKLSNGSLRGYPRVYDIALQMIAHGDGRWDPESLRRFVSAYQTITPLSLGELWAIPIMLRMALIENLRRVSVQVAAAQIDRNLADEWANQMTEVLDSDPKSLILVIADMARSDPPMNSPFVAELARRLERRGSGLALPLNWMEQRLLEDGHTIDQLIQMETHQQAINQVSVRNSIGSLRRLNEIDWRDFVQSMSVVDKVLQKDPIGTFDSMDFTTRDRYRHVVERLSRVSKKSEEEVATIAVQLAEASETGEGINFLRRKHVGFYLIGAGLKQLSGALGLHRSPFGKLKRLLSSEWGLICYLGLILLITAGLTYGLLFKAGHEGVHLAWLIILGFAAALCTSQLAVSLVNWYAMLLVSPFPLPKIDLSKGIPSEWRTLVVIPAMLANETTIEALVEKLEVRFLGNRDAHLHFALLTDFNDAASEHCANDDALLALARERIETLNTRYSADKGNIFFLFHRPRRWNEGENVWMGYERKRGKLADLNAVLRGDEKERFLLIVGNTKILSDVKYVITLDSDTQLPRDSARQLVGTMAHPLNQPYFNVTKQRVSEGYGIMQPRVSEAFSSAGLTRYARLFGGEGGIDPYTRMVSDVYQDLFDEGSFVGKGIYDVDIFKQVLEQKFPENRILSHDLLEGCYLRSGLVSDVPLYEQSPGSYLADVNRRARWIRGDWQLTGWLLPRVMQKNSRRVANPLSALSQWKLLDNLRRSLVAIAIIVFLGLSWTVLPSPNFWLGTILVIIILPTVAGILWELLCEFFGVMSRQYLATTSRAALKRFAQLIMYLAFLPHEAVYSFDAIARTCWRILVSHRHLLEWTPSDQVKLDFRNSALPWFRTMWAGPIAALAGGITLGINQPESLLFAAPLLMLWFISPVIARWISEAPKHREVKLEKAQIRFLHIIARKTWGFFETFVTEDDHWLPPDNYQEEPVEILAHRTSPTNMGLALLANLSAYDFGYLTMSQLLDRTSNTMRIMVGLERYKGHFYNWYDTQTLLPLTPRFVSTVDSGNLAAHLLTLRQGVLALVDAPLLNTRYLDGLTDTLDVIKVEMTENSLSLDLDDFRQVLSDAYTAFAGGTSILECCDKLCHEAERLVTLLASSNIESTAEWAQKLSQQCTALRDELMIFAEAFAVGLPPNATLCMLMNLAHDNKYIEASHYAAIKIAMIESLATKIFALSQMENNFLYDPASHLMTVGFNVDEQRRDHGNYDLLSSEARLGNFVAIAQGQIPQESWFALGRSLLLNNGEHIMVSWSGSMFEYLMPLVVMPSYDNTLLDQTCRAAVKHQIQYGKKRRVPWGISESGFNAVDQHLNYQYRAFGVPGLGLMLGLEDDLVIAPYATLLALMLAPQAACINLERLVAEGASGRYGFYEAIDFTPSRLPRGKKSALVRSFMAHHQGMSFLALSYLLHDKPMQRRFEADPVFQATLLLLQERIPKVVTDVPLILPQVISSSVSEQVETSSRVFDNPNTAKPEVQLLSNGRYHLMITQAGSGYSRWKDLAVTRWREDGTCDNWGLFGYIRDVDNNTFWSIAYQPTVGRIENFKAIFSDEHAEFTRIDNKFEVHTEIVVSPEDDIELRRIRIYNRAKNRRTLEFTSYAEVVLATQADDQDHPAFSNLFVETEILSERHAILATRRPRSEDEQSPWLCHLLNLHDEKSCIFSFETDRDLFIGRGRTAAAPRAMIEENDLSGTAGAVLDPIIAIRARLTLEPGAMVTLDLVTGVTETREESIALVEKYRDYRMANRVFELAWTHSQVVLRQLNATEADAMLYCQLASAIIYVSKTHRAEPSILVNSRRGQSSLWGYSISGDLPIVLLQIEELANIGLARQLIQAHAYWRQKGLAVDLVILNEEHSGYRQILQEQLTGLITPGTVNDRAGGIFVRAAEFMPIEDRRLLQSVARVIISDQRGSLAEQLASHLMGRSAVPRLMPSSSRAMDIPLSSFPTDSLQYFNGLGGFTRKGDEYVIVQTENKPTPAPWVNVLASPIFGTVISESGQAYTWTENAHELRLTPWENDPIQDSSGEAFYLRDEETGHFWSAAALPCRGRGEYITHHGFGYSSFKHIEDGIHSELIVYVALDAAIKFSVLKVSNDSSQRRRLSVTGYVEWVLGDSRSKTAMHVITEVTPGGALLARNHYNSEFGERVAFFNATTSRLEPTVRSITGDRYEFLGRNGSRQQPQALSRMRLSGRVGAGFDPCGAIQLGFDLAAGQTREFIFTLGAGQNDNEVEILLQRFHGTIAAQDALTAVHQYWHHTLKNIYVRTPEPTLDLLANGWLLYQVLSSRLWGRSGYYQSGGAFGFRDQLQDVMALVHTEPQLVRAHLLLCAAHQFVEGDVQHWWHPPHNRGVRTRCSDDYLWLPFVICHYVEATGDMAILNESIPFLQGRLLNPNEESYYDTPTISNEHASLYNHGMRAILNGLKFGVHGLPLMGSGDWNDGMNLVGIHGKGESIWLGFFLYTILKRFSTLARQYGDKEFAERCETESLQLQQKLESNGWDSEWYRRAYFDDGTPLGSSEDSECKIDSIAQSWSVLSGAAELSRAKQAMTALNQYLVKRDDAIILLLDPPFNKSNLNPGYIKGYVPGVRENGGQYTHAALWATMAFAELDEKQQAWSLFNIINPIHHGSSPEGIDIYKIEPYVIAADVYSVAPHTGRGGWSWYTGSAGWLYRLICESLLGLVLKDQQLHLMPRIPSEWEGFEMDYRFGKSIYHIVIKQNKDKSKITLDGIELEENIIPLIDDGSAHHVNLTVN